MKRLLFIFLSISILFFSCNSKQDNEIPVYDFEAFEYLLNQNDDFTYVINFWATWCKPCVEELPFFVELDETYKEKNVKVILVSLDFAESLEDRVIPFLESRNIHTKVVILDDPDANTWIPKVNKDWTGAIPATIIYNKTKSSFYEQSFTKDELFSIINQFIN